MWLDPNDANTLTVSGTTHVDEIRDKANVIDRLRFENSSPNGPNTTVVGGMTYLQFDGLIDFLTAKYSSSSTLQRSLLFTDAWEMHAVIRPDDASTNVGTTYQNDSIGPSDSGGYFGLYIRNDGAGNLVLMPYGWFGSDTRGEHTISKGDRLIFGHSKSAGTSNWSLYVGGAASVIGSYGNITGGSTGTVYLGRGYQARHYEGLIGEMCFFNAELSSGDRTTLISYLKAKWSL